MNCKPGDLAIVVRRGKNPRAPDLLGRIFTIVRPSEQWLGSWIVDPSPTCNGIPMSINDSALRPIRPAGDDKPTQETRALPKDRERVTEGA